MTRLLGVLVSLAIWIVLVLIFPVLIQFPYYLATVLGFLLMARVFVWVFHSIAEWV